MQVAVITIVTANFGPPSKNVLKRWLFLKLPQKTWFEKAPKPRTLVNPLVLRKNTEQMGWITSASFFP